MKRAVVLVATLAIGLLGCSGGDEGPEPVECQIQGLEADSVVHDSLDVQIGLVGPVRHVDLVVNGTVVAGADVAEPTPQSVTISWDTTQSTDGAQPVLARATGEEVEVTDDSDPVSVVVDNTAPVAAFGGARFPVAQGTVTIPLSIEEANPSQIRVLDGTTEIFTATAAAASFDWDVSSVEDGVRRLTLEVTDAAGHTAQATDFPVVVANGGEEVTLSYDPAARVYVPVNYQEAEYDTRADTESVERVTRMLAWLTWDSDGSWELDFSVGQGLCPHRGTEYTNVTSTTGEAVIDLRRSDLSEEVLEKFEDVLGLSEEEISSPYFPVNDDPLTFGIFFTHIRPLSPAEHVDDTLPITVRMVLYRDPE